MSAASKSYIIDLQGFVEAKNFILKELCILECFIDKCGAVNMCANDKFHHYIFKPPFGWKDLDQNARIKALWLKCFHHGFSWSSGDTEYSEIESIFDKILKKHTISPTVYVKGAEKIKWFNHFTKGKFSCINFEELGCDVNLSDFDDTKRFINKHCGKHDVSLHCALQNVNILHSYFYGLNYN